MTIKQQLIEAGYEKLAALYENKNSYDIPEMMGIVEEHEFLRYSSLALLVEQLKSLTVVTHQTEQIIWNDVQAVLEEFLYLEKESEFPYQLQRELVATYEKAARGEAKEIIQLATHYRELGYEEQAFVWYRLGAQMDHPEAIYWMSNYIYIGEIVVQDLQAVFEGYARAAELGHPDGLNNLADMYLRGEYVQQDDEQAFNLFMEAAKLGVPESMYTIGYMYGHGRGVQKDEEQSAYWYLQSALNGDVFAINKMGHQAFEKNEGMEAFSWYMKAAEMNDTEGEYNVGFCYESGIGTEVNIKQAKKWYRKAALKGDEESKRRLKEL